MKILITGLSLARNLGNPAMGLTLANRIKERFGDDVEIKFATQPQYHAVDCPWAQHYGYDLVEMSGLISRLLSNPLLKPLRYFRNKIRMSTYDVEEQKRAYRSFELAHKWADLVIHSGGLSYVGDTNSSWFISLASYGNYHYAKKWGVPFLRFAQSYGPFLDWRVRFLAKRELGSLPFVLTRGKTSTDYVRRLLPGQTVKNVPDVAVALRLAPGDDKWANDYLRRAELIEGEYLVLNPSAVLRGQKKSSSQASGEWHAKLYAKIAEHAIDGGKKVLFLPHMYSPDQIEDDRWPIREVCELLKENPLVHACFEELTATQTKALISKASGCIVSRFHAMVAAISTSTPVVAIGWNDKYKDLLEYYDAGDLAIHADAVKMESVVDDVFKKLESFSDERIFLIKDAHSQVLSLVDDAFEYFLSYIEKHIG